MEATKLLNIQDQLGFMSKEKLADIVAVDGNFLEDITSMTELFL